MKYTIHENKVIIYLHSKITVRLKLILWGILFAVGCYLLIVFSFPAQLLPMVLLPLAFLVWEINKATETAIFYLKDKIFEKKALLYSKKIRGSEIYKFDRVRSISGNGDYYILLQKKDKYGQGIKIMPRYYGVGFDRNKYVTEFEAKILPVVNQIID